MGQLQAAAEHGQTVQLQEAKTAIIQWPSPSTFRKMMHRVKAGQQQAADAARCMLARRWPQAIRARQGLTAVVAYHVCSSYASCMTNQLMRAIAKARRELLDCRVLPGNASTHTRQVDLPWGGNLQSSCITVVRSFACCSAVHHSVLAVFLLSAAPNQCPAQAVTAGALPYGSRKKIGSTCTASLLTFEAAASNVDPAGSAASGTDEAVRGARISGGAV